MTYTVAVKEFSDACNDGTNPTTPQLMDTVAVEFIAEMVNDELEELREATDQAEQADALVDAIYYICDTAVRHGLNLDRIFAIVHGANNVPRYPASKGCARLRVEDQNKLIAWLGLADQTDITYQNSRINLSVNVQGEYQY